MKIKLFLLPFFCSLFCFLPFISRADTLIADQSFSYVYRDSYNYYSNVYSFEYTPSQSDTFSPFVFYITANDSSSYGVVAYVVVPSTTTYSKSYWFNNLGPNVSSGTLTPSNQGDGYTFAFMQMSGSRLYHGSGYSECKATATPYGPTFQRDNSLTLDYQAKQIAKQLISSGNVPDWVGSGEIDPEDGSLDIPIPPIPDPDDWIPDYGLIPAPDLMFTNTNDGANKSWYTFVCNNNQPNYYIELQCLWYTFNDYSLRKKGFSWYVDYDEIQYNMLANGTVAKQHIVNVSDLVSAEGIVDIHQAALYGLNNFLDNYPFSSLNNITPSSVQSMSGYPSKLQDLANNYVSKYVEAKIWVRYFTFENGDIRYGAWTPYKFNIPPSGDLEGAEPNDPIPDPDDPIPDPEPDPDIDDPEPDPDNPWPIPIPDGTNLLQNIVDWLNDLIASVSNVSNTILGFFTSSVNQLGQYPTLLARVFQFLPQWFISAISIGMLTAIILRIFGR